MIACSFTVPPPPQGTVQSTASLLAPWVLLTTLLWSLWESRVRGERGECREGEREGGVRGERLPPRATITTMGLQRLIRREAVITLSSPSLPSLSLSNSMQCWAARSIRESMMESSSSSREEVQEQ